ncbi:hypothetical protein [Murine herpesvirus strain 4556]|uniref:Uncharacterized protein n=2 Tax=Orthoherpesviridae TaxID=3044472 RepID=O41934_MHV68|nr:unknown [Murid gammaherpesvirus 4]AXP99163.1 unknown protein [synthetic construct]QJQ80207.1 hypothetical protein [Murine herpesvirus]UNZ86644.1 hypothetical protein [Murine herpesvirus strain 72]UNZ86721.1 hypothetical protein [Murine herpesvirus strain 4556]AAB66391.1 unknown [Murid gammaherpesvirus 4]
MTAYSVGMGAEIQLCSHPIGLSKNQSRNPTKTLDSAKILACSLAQSKQPIRWEADPYNNIVYSIYYMELTLPTTPCRMLPQYQEKYGAVGRGTPYWIYYRKTLYLEIPLSERVGLKGGDTKMGIQDGTHQRDPPFYKPTPPPHIPPVLEKHTGWSYLCGYTWWTP